MPKLLVVEASPRGDKSVSRHMTRRFAEGSPIAARDVATQYLRLILNGIGIGIKDATFVADGGAKVVDMGEKTMDAFVGSLAPQIEEAAA